MLITKHNFQMVNSLTITHKSKMSWFNYTSMNWSNCNLVNFFTFHFEKWILILIYPNWF